MAWGGVGTYRRLLERLSHRLHLCSRRRLRLLLSSRFDPLHLLVQLSLCLLRHRGLLLCLPRFP